MINTKEFAKSMLLRLDQLNDPGEQQEEMEYAVKKMEEPLIQIKRDFKEGSKELIDRLPITDSEGREEMERRHEDYFKMIH